MYSQSTNLIGDFFGAIAFFGVVFFAEVNFDLLLVDPLGDGVFLKKLNMVFCLPDIAAVLVLGRSRTKTTFTRIVFKMVLLDAWEMPCVAYELTLRIHIRRRMHVLG